MLRRIAIIGLALMFATPLFAQSVKLTAAEISTLLTGNTAVGVWEGAKYRQFFNEDGSTIYAKEGGQFLLGEWQIDVSRDEYQSIWAGDVEWEGWYVMEYLGTYFWVSKRTPPTPFKMLEGQRLSMPKD
jgi:hypothetical protein